MGKGFIALLKDIIEGIFDIVFPPEEVCISCLEEHYVGLCPSCFKRIKRVASGNDIFSYGYYVGPLKDLILAVKYKESYLAGTILGELLCEMIEENNFKFNTIIYVPLSKKSIKRRGFNQCEILGKIISKKYNIPISKSLVKIKETKEQKILSREEREENTRDAFTIINKDEVKGKDIILIDDVITTGFTVLECRRILERYGARTVTILTVAQVLN